MKQSSRLAGLSVIIVPTPIQAIVAIVISSVAMGTIQREALSRHFSNGGTVTFSPTHQFNLQVAHVLGLYLVGQAAIVIFWAIVGLFAYLLVWWIHNLVITAENEVIVHTSYVNQKGNNFDLVGTALRLLSIILLIGSTALLPYGLNTWLMLWQPLLNSDFTLIGVALVLGSVFGFAAELYLSFMLFQLMVDRFRR
jgi:hypothetical protein